MKSRDFKYTEYDSQTPRPLWPTVFLVAPVSLVAPVALVALVAQVAMVASLALVAPVDLVAPVGRSLGFVSLLTPPPLAQHYTIILCYLGCEIYIDPPSFGKS